MIVGIGIDIIEVDRMQRSVQRFGESFLNRIFTERELKYCNKKSNRYQLFAVIFAAKEALLKAIGTGLRDGISWQEIEIINDKFGKPVIYSRGKCGRIIRKLCVSRILISLSYTDIYGVALVVLEQIN